MASAADGQPEGGPRNGRSIYLPWIS